MLKAIGLRVTLGFFFVSAIMVLFISIAANIQMNRSVSMQTESIQNHLRSAAMAASQYIGAEELDLYHTIEDAQSPEYQELKRKLMDFAERYHVLYVYYWRDYGNGQLQYIADNDTDPEYMVGPWSIYEVEDIAADALSGNNGVTDLGSYTPTWDGLITGYAPVYDSNGDFYCVAGVDLSDEPIYLQRKDSRNMTIIQIIALLVSVVFGILNMQLYSRKAKQAEEANINLQAAIAAAENANSAKSKFLATMSHEIRNPMNAILGITQIQLQQDDLPDSYGRAFEKIYSSGNNLLGIINDILDLSKIETGKLELHPAEYDTASLINDAVQLNIVRIGSKPLEFILNVDENLPQKLYGDELRLKQILNNLLSNAIKYTEQGHVSLAVSCAAKGGDAALTFVVEDTGQGMQPEDQARLFAEYTRFNDETNRQTEGTGLGLSITKHLVDMMDGDIKVESAYGKGSVFTVTLRQKTAGSAVIGAELAARLRDFTFAEKKLYKKIRIAHEPMPYGKVLVVDDVETNLYVAAGLLLPYQLEIDTVKSGYAAIERVKSGKIYDVIFMDHMMPRLDGIETTRILREQGYTGSIVALTANALTGNEKMFKSNGLDGFIPKPIDVRQLDAALHKFVRDKHLAETQPYAPESAVPARAETNSIHPIILKAFRHDAKNAMAVLRDTAENNNLKLFTTTVHGMKSALANIGEHDASRQALVLENAGRGGDMETISANTESFIETLAALIEKFRTAETGGFRGAEVAEDTDFLRRQLQSLMTACKDFDDEAAYAALDRLREKQWLQETADTLERINDALFINSDLDAAAAMSGELLEKA